MPVTTCSTGEAAGAQLPQQLLYTASQPGKQRAELMLHLLARRLGTCLGGEEIMLHATLLLHGRLPWLNLSTWTFEDGVWLDI